MNSCINIPFGLSQKEKDNFKKQYWFIEIYEDSVKENYLSILESLQYKIAISPWHDKDINTNGEIKKKHRHILINFGGSVRVKQVTDIANMIEAKSDVMWVGNKQSAFEYLTHQNDYDKYQYDVNDIILINSKIYDWRQSAYKDILNYIDDNQIISLKQLTIKLRKDNNDYLLKYVSDNTVYIQYYLKECYNNYGYDLKILNQYINECIKSYEIDKLIKSESLNRVKSQLEKLNIEFNIIVD